MRYKRLYIIGSSILISFTVLMFFFHKQKKHALEEDKKFELSTPITINIDGEIDRTMELLYTKPVSYGVLFMRINIILNEYSDLSSFVLDEVINASTKITIPTKDISNAYAPEVKIDIHNATLSDLIKLPQVGEKRAKKILDYISKNGKFDSWDTFFKIASIPNHAKDQIKKQAFL